jgi:hypothetical protein
MYHHPSPLPQTQHQNLQTRHHQPPDLPQTRQNHHQTHRLLPAHRQHPLLLLSQNGNGRVSRSRRVICIQTQMLAILALVNSNTRRTGHLPLLLLTSCWFERIGRRFTSIRRLENDVRHSISLTFLVCLCSRYISIGRLRWVELHCNNEWYIW